jgi:TatD DNase family protein
MIDSHCHIHYLEDMDGVLERMKGLKKIMVIVDAAAENPEEIIKGITALRSRTKTQILIALGCHPCSVEKITLQDLTMVLNKLLPKVDCLGEIGLDFSRKNTEKSQQLEFLKVQCQYAERFGLPINIHARDCTMAELIGEIENYKITKILHCNTFGWEDVKAFVEIGGFVSFSGIVTFKKRAEHIQEAAKKIPLDRILLETDSPFLSPEPHRGKTNEPHRVKYIYDYIAGLRGIASQALIDQVGRNFALAMAISE